MSIHQQAELIVIQAVKTGELSIDRQGRIWRHKKRHGDRWRGGTKTSTCELVRAENRTKDGYLQIRSSLNGKRVCAAAHRLVFLYLKGPIPQGMTVNHEDGVKDNNEPTNLNLATYSEQRHHAIKKLGAGHWDCRGDNHPKRQATTKSVIEMRRRRASGEQVKSIAAAYGMKTKAVSAICSGRTWKHV